MASVMKEFFSNDIVYRFDKHKRICLGVVIDSYEDDNQDSLQKGDIRVQWLNGSGEQVLRQNHVHLMNRQIIPGDFVRRLTQGHATQRGYCKKLEQLVTVQLVGSNTIIERVASDRLKHVSQVDQGYTVCLGEKYGKILNWNELITMLSKDGSKVTVPWQVELDVEDCWLAKRNVDGSVRFYPGQEVMCTPSKLKLANWIHQSRSLKKNMHQQRQFTIVNVETTDMEVMWFEFSEANFMTYTEHLCQEDIEKLKILPLISAQYCEFTERRLLQLKESDVLVQKRDWLRRQSSLYNRNMRKCQKRKCATKLKKSSTLSTQRDSSDTEKKGSDDSWTSSEDDCNNETCSVAMSSLKPHLSLKKKTIMLGLLLPVEVVCIESKATVVWQDGTVEKDIPTTQLCYSDSLDEIEFFPGECVTGDNKNETCYGVIQQVDSLERTATVKWFNYSEEKLRFLNMEEMSIYSLSKHFQFTFLPGSTVIHKPAKPNKMGYVLNCSLEGYVTVRWLDGSVEDCCPQQLEELDTDEDSFVEEVQNESDAAQALWESEDESAACDITDETILQYMAERLDLIRSKIICLKESIQRHSFSDNVLFLADLLFIYSNSDCLDKLLDTSFFSSKSRHFQALLGQVKERFKALNIELLNGDRSNSYSLSRIKYVEKEIISKLKKLQDEVNEQSSTKLLESESPADLDIDNNHSNLSIELLSMIKVRMDLVYAEIVSRISASHALYVITKASELPAVPVISATQTTPADPQETTGVEDAPLKLTTECENEFYSIIEEAHCSHYFQVMVLEPIDKGAFMKAVQKEHKLLQGSLPSGVWVRSYADRMDLLSVMIQGPNNTPYEDGLFLFDIQLSPMHPRAPPSVYFISYISERINPNLYEDGKVCLSLLGTWVGRGSEVWGSSSTLLQLIVSIQGLILVAEPYYNEPGFEKQCNSQQGTENSRTYNEFVILKLIQSMTQMLKNPSHTFKQEILKYFMLNGTTMCERLVGYCRDTDPVKPDFPLLPVSKGFKLSLRAAIATFQETLNKAALEEQK